MFKTKTRKATRDSCRPQMARSLKPRLDRQKVNRKPGTENKKRELFGRSGKYLLRGLGFILLLALVTAGLLSGYTALATSPRFKVTSAQVSGTRRLSRWEVLRAAGVGSQSNLIALPLGKIQNRVSRLPWVKEARVSRQFPGTVRIQVVERQASFLALVQGRLIFLAQDLKAFVPFSGGRAPDQPVITGLSMRDLKNPDAETLSLLHAAGSFLTAWGGKNHRRAGLSEVHLDRVWGLELVFDDMPAVVRMGLGGFQTRLTRLEKIKKDLSARGELSRAVLIDLLAKEKAVVRLGEETA